MMSACPGARIAEGFNAYNGASGKARTAGGKQYQITGTYTSLAFAGDDGSTGAVTPDSGGLFTLPVSGVITVTGGGDDTCINLVWSGARNDQWEAYRRRDYDLNGVTLRGYPRLDGNDELYFDGD
ncbi:MAG: hypothetical protein II782_10565, partial [Oscillospiraceae bacterium]|nr:hypothetical protein [Oscillospiraceae bacterium]